MYEETYEVSGRRQKPLLDKLHVTEGWVLKLGVIALGTTPGHLKNAFLTMANAALDIHGMALLYAERNYLDKISSWHFIFIVIINDTSKVPLKSFLYEEVPELRHLPTGLQMWVWWDTSLRYFLSNLVQYGLGVAYFSENCLTQLISKMVQTSDYQKL